jgi:peptidoglycan/LPS O-acetylase OafA/YrhL
LFSPIPSSSRILPHGWTLVIEILISIILPFLIYLMRGSKAALFIFTIFCTKLLGFHLSIIVFVCGIYLYEYKYEITEKTKKYSIISRLLLFLIGWLLFTLEFYSPSSVVKLLSKIFINYLIPGCLILFIIIVSSETIKRILQKPVLLHLGKISYSMYLIHFNVIIFFSGYISSFCNTYLTKNVYIDYFSFVLIMTTIMLFFSNVFYYVIERSVLIFGKHLLLKFYKE